MRSLGSVLLAASMCLLPAVSQASTITSLSDNFSSATVLLGQIGTIDGNFTTVGNTNVDVVGPGNFGYLCETAGANCVDLAGTPSGTGYVTDPNNGSSEGILQSSSQFAAGTYFLTFDLTGSQRGIDSLTTVTFGNYSQLFDLSSGAPNSGPTDLLVTLSAPGYLTFADGTPGNVGSILNSVQVAQTPEPSSLALLGSGLLAGARFVSRRRRQTAA